MSKTIKEKHIKEIKVKKTKKEQKDPWADYRQDIPKSIIKTIILTVALAVILLIGCLTFGIIGIWFNIEDIKDLEIFAPGFYLVPTIVYFIYAAFLIATIVLNMTYLKGRNYNKSLLAIVNMIFVLIIPGVVLLFLHKNNKDEVTVNEMKSNHKEISDEFQGHATVIKDEISADK